MDSIFLEFLQKTRENIDREERRKGMKDCNHLFVKLKEREVVYGFHSSDYYETPPVIECKKCGLTNKFMDLEREFSNTLNESWNSIVPDEIRDFKTIESEVFKEECSNLYRRCGKSFDDSTLRYVKENDKVRSKK